MTQLDLSPALTKEDWEAVGKPILEFFERDKKAELSTAMWLLGDWYAFGENRYEKPENAVSPAAAKSISSAVWVCRRIQPERRIATLPFAAHQYAANLGTEEEADTVLRMAQEEGWTVSRVKDEVDRLLGKPKKPSKYVKIERAFAERLASLLVVMLVESAVDIDACRACEAALREVL